MNGPFVAVLLLSIIVGCSAKAADRGANRAGAAEVTASVLVVVAQPGRVVVNLLFKNEGSQSVRLPSWLFFSKCQVRDRGIHIRDASKNEMVFRGRFISYGADEPQEILPPGESLKVEHLDLTEFYKFPETAQELWIRFDSLAFLASGASLDVRSKEIGFKYVPQKVKRSGRPVDGHVVERRKNGKELIVACATQ